jgi:hypothetical protein
LIQGSIAVEQLTLESLIKALIKMDTGSPARTSSADSWEDLSSGLADIKHDGAKATDLGHAKILSWMEAGLAVVGILPNSDSQPNPWSMFHKAILF